LYLAGASAAVGAGGIVAAAACAWLLGVTLIGAACSQRSATLTRIANITRTVGALCLIGLPLTVGFIGQAGLAAGFATRGAAGLALLLGLILTLAGLAFLLLRHVVAPAVAPLRGEPIALPLNLDSSRARDAAGWLAALVPALAFGIAPSLLNAGTLLDALARNGIVGWLSWLIALGLGAALWRTRARWWPRLSGNGRQRAATILKLSWLYSLLGGAGNRLSAPFARVFTFLESDGALLWAMIIALLLLLIARPGGP
jgi:hypothetical protein